MNNKSGIKKNYFSVNTADRKEKILLLTDIPPSKNYTGGLQISNLLRFLIEEKLKVECFCVMNKNLQPNIDLNVFNDINLEIYDKPEENFEISNISKRQYYFKINRLKRKLNTYIKKNKITKVWGIIQGEVITSLMESVKNNDVDYVVQIWDPIEWWIKENHFNENRSLEVLKKYELVVSNASCCMTSSFAMSKEYSEKYKVKCIEIMSPLNKPNILFDKAKKNNDSFVISISGQIYAKNETENLLLALQRINWIYKGKKIIFKYYGIWSNNYINLKKFNNYSEHVQIKGFLPHNKLLEELSYSDLLYCPYFFSKENYHKKVSELSFPSKLISYMALNVPVLLHAPNYSSPYVYINKINGGFLLDTMDIEKIVKKIKEIMDINYNYKNKLIKNANISFLENFSFDKVKRNLFTALDIKYLNNKKLRILEVNNVDLPGKRFNGYDLQKMINSDTCHSAKQIVTYKTSNDNNVIKFYNSNKILGLAENLINAEAEFLSVHSQISLTSNVLLEHDEFINSDLVHYHLIHNTKLSLSKMVELCNKPSIITIHDPWNFTGRCVHPQECSKWKTGCKNCENLDTLFPLNEDNSNSLWKLKKKIYKKLDVDIVVTTPFMMNMMKKSPLTKNFENVHLIPFGIDLNKFNDNVSKEEAREKLKIDKKSVVLFFRAQMASKGTEFIIEALEQLNTKANIVLVSCDEVGLLDGLSEKYTVMDLGNIKDDELIIAYRACDIFLMPSRGESFGLMAIEAMACHRPVIVFDNSALPSVTFAPECGVLVENKNSIKLMNAIKWLIEDETEREKRGILGRKLAEKYYNVNDYNKKMVDLYEKAYERQKNKNKNKIDISKIDYNLVDVQFLISKLKNIFYSIFNDQKLEVDFIKHEKKYIIKDGYKIDYSIESVQNVINQFNDYLFNLLKEENLFKLKNKDFGKMFLYEKIIYLIKNDRGKLKIATKKRLKNHKILYLLINFFYKFLRKIKRIIFNDDRKLIIFSLNMLNNKLSILMEENIKILDEFNKISKDNFEDMSNNKIKKK